MDAIAIGGLVVEELVVNGGFSRVYRGWDPLLARAVAIKVFRLTPEKEARLPFPREVWRRRFVAEARLLAGLDHPHLVRINGLGRLADGSLYMLMPWYVANLRREIGRDGTDPDWIAGLPPLQRPRPVAPSRAADILRQVCLGLAPLHARGYVHRDIKPTNLLLTAREGGIVKICDLGLAKIPGEVDKALAIEEVWLGTPDYAAPEQMDDATKVDDRADVYSVGVLGWRLLTGRLPAAGGPSLAELAPSAPAALVEMIGAAMAPRPDARPTVLQMAAGLSAMTVESAGAGGAETW